MAHHWPKEVLFGTAQLSLGPNGAVNYDYIVTNSINSLLIGSRCMLFVAQWDCGFTKSVSVINV